MLLSKHEQQPQNEQPPRLLNMILMIIMTSWRTFETQHKISLNKALLDQ